MVVIVLICLIFYMDLLIYADYPASKNDRSKIFTVSKGNNLFKTSENLHNTGLINSPFKFRLLARIKGYDKKVKAGEFTLSPAMSPIQILDLLVAGKVKLHRLTIPEGYNLQQIGTAITDAGFGTKKEFMSLSIDTKLIQKIIGTNAPSFEGYLFPDTYFFPKTATPMEIISVLGERFWKEFKPEWKKQCREIGLSIHEVVTLASIIEKETGAPFERPLISSVFHNRLKRGMKLQTDPTVIYGLKSFKGNLTRKHLLTPTPYNTYVIQGLPPGPIASPGSAAIKAALFPADTKYLYFVSKKDTTHQFSTNLIDHNKAVRKYQLRR